MLCRIRDPPHSRNKFVLGEVQRRAIRIIGGTESLSFEETKRHCGLFTLRKQTEVGGMVWSLNVSIYTGRLKSGIYAQDNIGARPD